MPHHVSTKVMAILTVLLVGLAMLAPAIQAAPNKITLCHYDAPNSTPKQITVSQPLVDGHLQHGDFLGPGAQDCRQSASPSGFCNDNNACTTDTCNTSNGTCAHFPVNCDDANLCTIDSCNPSRGCQHVALNCDDRNVCTTDSCDPSLGCKYVPVSCDDGTRCTTDSCDPVTGCAHGTVSCDDGNRCTEDSCANETGCANKPVVCPMDRRATRPTACVSLPRLPRSAATASANGLKTGSGVPSTAGALRSLGSSATPVTYREPSSHPTIVGATGCGLAMDCCGDTCEACPGDLRCQPR